MPELTDYRVIRPNRFTRVGQGDTFCQPNLRIRGSGVSRTATAGYGGALRRLSWRFRCAGRWVRGKRPAVSPRPWVSGSTRLKVRN